MITPSRRNFITGLASLVAAPAIVRAGSLMPVKVIEPEWPTAGYYYEGRLWFKQGHRAANPPMLIGPDWVIPMPVHPSIWADLVDNR